MANTKVTSAVIADNAVGIDQLNVSDGTNGQVLTTNGSGTLSFSTISGYTDSDVESYLNTSAIYTDATNDRLGLGTSSPNANLHIGSANATGDATNPALQIGGAGTYRLGLYTSTEGAVIANANGDDGIQFVVKTAGEAMRIDGGTGDVGIGTSSPSKKLHVLASANEVAVIENSGAGWANMEFRNSDCTGNGVRIGMNSTENLNLSNHEEGKSIILRTTATGGSVTERMRINNSGVVSINGDGVNTGFSTDYLLQIGSDGAGSNNFGIMLRANTSGTSKLGFDDGVDADGYGRIWYSHANDTMDFYTANNHAMVIEDDGTLCVNRTSKFGAAGTASMIVIQGSQATMRVGAPNTNDFPLLAFYNGGLGVIGNIYTNGTTGVTYETGSDYRLKENVNYDWDAIPIISQLKPAKYNWIADDMDGIEEGFIAHEVQEILPYVVSGEKDAIEPAILYEEDDREVRAGTANVGDIKEEEKIKPQTMDYGRLTPILVKAIQEQQTIIDDLKARIETLENA